ncbi:MAG: hypothetical protein ACLUOS_16895 [Odoribacter splanchnicus]
MNGNANRVDKKQDEMAGYVDFRQHLYRWLTLDLGVRIDHHSHGDRMGSQAGLCSLLRMQR